jgi:hypothetical protein
MVSKSRCMVMHRRALNTNNISFRVVGMMVL